MKKKIREKNYSMEQSEDELALEQDQSDKVSFYEDYVEALMEFCEKRSNAPKSEEEQSTEQEQNHSELAEQSQQLEQSKYIFLDDHCIDVDEVDKTLNEIEELKCLLDHQVITEKEFYIKCDKFIRFYDMPF